MLREQAKNLTMYQEIIDCKGMETPQIFSRMFVTAKKIKELFASTLNKITAGVRCVYLL